MSGEDGFGSEWSLEASIRTHLWNYKILSFREKIQGKVRESQKPNYHCGNHGLVCLLILSTNNFFCFICILIRSWSQREQRNLVNLALWLCLLLMRKKKKLSRLVSFECSQIIYRGNLGVCEPFAFQTTNLLERYLLKLWNSWYLSLALLVLLQVTYFWQ